MFVLKTAQVTDSFVVEQPSTNSFVDAIKKTNTNKRFARSRVFNKTNQDSTIQSSNPEDLFNQWKQDPSKTNSTLLLNSLEPEIKKSVIAYTGESNPITLGRAKIMLMKSMGRYDGRSSLNTFVRHQTRPIQRWAAANRTGVKIPRTSVSDRNLLMRVENNLLDTLGRAPSRAELADASGFSMGKISRLMKLNLPSVSESTISSEDGDKISASDQAVDSNMDQLWMKTVYYGLNPINQFILEHSIGLNGARVLSNEQIARKLKISSGAVSQRKANIQRMLDTSSASR